jgi:hypothetical protein
MMRPEDEADEAIGGGQAVRIDDIGEEVPCGRHLRLMECPNT